MLIMMLRHPRKQGWHDLAVTSVMIKERLLAPPVQPARAAVGAQQSPPAQVRSTSQPQPSGVRAAAPSYAPSESYAPAGNSAPPDSGMAPASSGASYAAAVPPSGSAAPYGGNAYAPQPQGAPDRSLRARRTHRSLRARRTHRSLRARHTRAPQPQGAPYAPPPDRSSPTSQPSGDELSSSGRRLDRQPVRCHRCHKLLLPVHRRRMRICRRLRHHPVILRIRPLVDPAPPTSRIGRSCWTTEGESRSRDSCCLDATHNRRPARRTRS